MKEYANEWGALVFKDAANLVWFVMSFVLFCLGIFMSFALVATLFFGITPALAYCGMIGIVAATVGAISMVCCLSLR